MANTINGKELTLGQTIEEVQAEHWRSHELTKQSMVWIAIFTQGMDISG